MKKFECIVALLMTLCCVMGCCDEKKISAQNESTQEYNQTQLAEESSQEEWGFSEINVNGSEFVVSAHDLYDECGYGWYECEKSGIYYFQSQGTKEDIYSLHPYDIVWKVYILDQPFSETPRFLPQAGFKEVLVGDGSVEVKKGQYIVIYCSQNAYEYGLKAGYDGDEEACYQCVLEE